MASEQVAAADKVTRCYEFEVEMALAVDILWEALKNVNSLLAKVAPDIIASLEEKVEGEVESGKPCITRTIKYGSFAPAGTYVKDKIVMMDEKARKFKTEELEGGHLAQGFTKFSQSATVQQLNPGAISTAPTKSKSILKFEIEYQVDQTKLREADVLAHIDKTKEMLTALARLTEVHVHESSAASGE